METWRKWSEDKIESKMSKYSTLFYTENFGEVLRTYKSIEIGLALRRRAMVFSPPRESFGLAQQ